MIGDYLHLDWGLVKPSDLFCQPTGWLIVDVMRAQG
jgi:hypothetical protein